MTDDDIAAMPRELRDAGSEGRTLKDAWETCEKSAELIEDQIAELAKARATIIADAAIKAAQAAEIKRLRDVLGNILDAITSQNQHGDSALTITGSTANLKWLIEAEEDARAALEGTPK